MSMGPANQCTRSMAPSGANTFTSQTVRSDFMVDSNQQVHTESFAESTVGNHVLDVRETQQAYSNSLSNIRKTALERQIRGQGRKVIMDYGQVGAERQTDLLVGITQNQVGQFGTRW